METTLYPSEKNQFLSQNHWQLSQLSTFVDFADGFTLGFVEVNSKIETDWIIERLNNVDQSQYQFLILSFPSPDLRFLLDEVGQRLKQTTLSPNKKLLLIIREVEKSIGFYQDYPPILQDLNFVRDLYPKQLPYPILFCLPSYAITRLAKFAPDFWAWKSGIFLFQGVIQPQDNLSSVPSLPYQQTRLYKTPETQSRVEFLNSLYDEYSQTPNPQTVATFLTILHQLGVAYFKQGEYAKGEHYLREGLALAKETPALTATIGDISYDLGKLLKFLDQREEALERYEEALQFYRQIGSRLGEANTLKAIGDVLQFLKQSEEALERYEEALQFYRQIGDRLGEANTLIAIGDVLQFLKQSEEALERYEAALQFYRQIGSVLGEANTLQEMGKLQEDPKEALSYYREAMALYEQINDRYSQMRHLYQFVHPLLQQLNQEEEARQCLQQAYQLAKEIGFELPPLS